MQNTLDRAVQHWEMVAPAIDVPRTSEDYEALLANISELMNMVGNRHQRQYSGLLKAMTTAAKEYEGNCLSDLRGSGLHSLRYLVKLHRVKQSELKEIGSQGVVSEVLNGKRSLTLRHVRELARRFNVSPGTFIDN
jgi:HTH-type transcriptional regulator/antitoxin HigA